MIHHGLKTIFIHIPRTGGTSIRSVLEKIPTDIIEKWIHSHADWKEYKYRFPTVFEKYFKFAVVRNPFDKVLSSWRYKTSYEGITYTDFDKWIKALDKNNDRVLYSQFYWIGNPVKIDYVCKFEELENSWKYICKKLNINKKLKILNKGKHYLEQKHTKTSIEIIERRFEKDIKYWEYKLEQ